MRAIESVSSRFTPTGVGTMRSRVPSSATPTVHPHGRGDNLVSGAGWWTVLGSPPRAWGQFALARRRAVVGRFTPTGVGTIIRTQRRSNTRTVHPHGRGDNAYERVEDAGRGGSPPRAWGQSSGARHATAHPRFTPTGVGTIVSPARSCRVSAVHPHGRGDNSAGVNMRPQRGGSPPRAWGQ